MSGESDRGDIMNTAEGKNKLIWAKEHMPVVSEVRKILKDKGNLKGRRIAMALHVEAKTGILAWTLKEAGAEVALTGCNPLSTDDDVVSSLNRDFGVNTYGRKGMNDEEYYENLNKVLDIKPDIIIDDGGDLTKLVHTTRDDVLDGIIGGNEETTTGIVRLKAMEKDGVLKIPMFDVNDAKMKHFFDNRYGTGQSTFDGIMSATNLVIAGKNVVVGGYGWCGKGIAMRASGLGANVIVTEVDSVKAVEAIMDGFRVMPMNEASKEADFIITATGCKDVVTMETIKNIKNGCVVCNSGHFDNEIDVKNMKSSALKVSDVRSMVKKYEFENGKIVYVLADGRLVNLSAGQGHPVEIMDMSFAIQALCAERLFIDKNIENKVYAVPEDIDTYVANVKLQSMGVNIDELSEEQRVYLNSWQHGT